MSDRDGPKDVEHSPGHDRRKSETANNLDQHRATRTLASLRAYSANAHSPTYHAPDTPGGSSANLNKTRASMGFATSPVPSRKVSTASFDDLSPAAADRVFPIRSVVTVDPLVTSNARNEKNVDDYFSYTETPTPQSIRPHNHTDRLHERSRQTSMANSTSDATLETKSIGTNASDHSAPPRPRHQTDRHTHDVFTAIAASPAPGAPHTAHSTDSRESSVAPPSIRSVNDDVGGGLLTARFKHVVTEGGHMVITGRDGETLQRCEDEPIHIPGAIQNFGLLIALEETSEGVLLVRVVSENSHRLIGYTPRQLFALKSFTDILSEDQTDNLLDHIDFIRDDEADVAVNGPEVFTMSIRSPHRRSQKLWCAMHINDRNPNLLICEFELEDDPDNPLVPANDATPEPPEDTLQGDPTPEELQDSTENASRPLRVLRSARKRKGEAAAMEVFNIMSQVQEQLASAPNLERFLKTLVGVVKELTGFHRVMIYQFDQSWNGRVVTELVDPRATKDLYKGLNFPASDIPKQARDLYKVNKVRMLYDRSSETARLVCRTMEDLATPLDLTYSYLRAMSPIHIKYLANMAVRSSMSISINAFEELWGLIACHTYGSKGMRVSFPIRKMCRLVGDSASRNIERLSYASRLQARKLINTVPTSSNPSGYIIASSEDLLKLFDADLGLLSIRDETKVMGDFDQSHEALALLEYLRMRCITNVMTSQDLKEDFPDLRYAPGFKVIAGLLLVPLSVGGQDFIVFFRKGQTKEVKWAGNPYEKFVKAGTEGYLEPRKSFKTWSETVVGKCREWAEEEIETAAVLCLVYGKFIEVWRQKEAALQNSQLTRLLLANSAHEVRTPLNAIINYLEIAMEGSLDTETRDNLAKSHSASKSLIYVINDLLDLTKTEEGGELVKEENFDLRGMLQEATQPFAGDARRKNIAYSVIEQPGLPDQVKGDQRKIRQAISNVTANAIQHTSEGSVTIELYVAQRHDSHVDIECSVADTGSGINTKKLDALFRELEQVQSEATTDSAADAMVDGKALTSSPIKSKKILGLGLAVVARVIRNMNGQMRLKSEEGKGSRFVLQFPLEVCATPGQFSVTKGEGEDTTSLTTLEPVVSPPVDAGEVMLIDRATPCRSPIESRSAVSATRRNSADSTKSYQSMVASIKSQSSTRSEADRLIDAIQEPHLVNGSTRSSDSLRPSTSDASKTRASHRRNSAGKVTQATWPKHAHDAHVNAANKLQRRRGSTEVTQPGQMSVVDQGTPIRPVKVADETGVVSPLAASNNAHPAIDRAHVEIPETSGEKPTADHMRVLVAEDDPVNSKIIQKRLTKLGHEVVLTVNGEECASLYGEKSGYFDVILMDMQVSTYVYHGGVALTCSRCPSWMV